MYPLVLAAVYALFGQHIVAIRLVLAMLFLLGVALPLTPWTIHNFYIYGQIVIVEPRLIQLLPRVGPVQQERMDNEPERKIK
jgi:hypothetical protein